MAENCALPIRLAAQEFSKGQSFTAGFLQLQQAQHTLATGHVQALLAGLQHRARCLLRGLGQNLRRPNLQGLTVAQSVWKWV